MAIKWDRFSECSVEELNRALAINLEHLHASLGIRKPGCITRSVVIGRTLHDLMIMTKHSYIGIQIQAVKVNATCFQIRLITVLIMIFEMSSWLN